MRIGNENAFPVSRMKFIISDIMNIAQETKGEKGILIEGMPCNYSKGVFSFRIVNGVILIR